MDNDGTLFAPSVTKTARIPAVFEAAGYNVAHVKSFKDLPSSKVVDKTVLVVDLPATQLGDLRSENLQLNGIYSIFPLRNCNCNFSCAV